jgi:selenocysteine lyase/cysteine desulfurase
MTDIILKDYHDVSDENINKLVYKRGSITTPFHDKTKVTYADYIASGLPSPIIEEYITKEVYPYYSNTHSNSRGGQIMVQQINDVKNYIRKEFNLSDDYQILFNGSGCTSCSNHLANSIECKEYDKIVIFISLYEHYSNYLPWKKLAESCKKIDLRLIPFVSNSNNSGIIDIEWLTNSISELYTHASDHKKTLIVCSITASSNINGIITPLKKIRKILDAFQDSKNFKKYFFADYACSAPYVKIDGSILDAFFFSSHKFIGGVSGPGILVAKKCLFSKTCPYTVGGGCVSHCTSKKVVYDPDIEAREMAGTPNIIGIIKFGKVLQLKNQFQAIIDKNEHILAKLVKEKIKEFSKKYPTFRAVLYNDNIQHLPIFSFHLTNLHFNLIVVLLNDLFGIQTRGGIGCCGILAEIIEQSYGYRGWCRVSFHWLMSKKTVMNIFDAVEYVIKNGEKFKKYYEFDEQQHLYFFKGKK